MNKSIWLLAGLLIAGIIFASGCIGETKQAACGTHTETYTTNALGCDQMQNCQCMHKQYVGLGSCDSCQCTREVSNC